MVDHNNKTQIRLKIDFVSLLRDKHSVREDTTLKIIVPLEEDLKTFTIEQLRSTLQAIVAKKLSRPSIALPLLTTIDGYELENQFTLQQALIENNLYNRHVDTNIIALDCKALNFRLAKTLSEKSTTIYTFEKTDFGDSRKKQITVGTLRTTGQLFIKMIVGSQCVAFQLYSVDDIENIIKVGTSLGKQHLIASYNHLDELYENGNSEEEESKQQQYELLAKFKKTEEDLLLQKAVTILLSIKTTSDETPATYEIPLELNQYNRIKKRVTQNANTTTSTSSNDRTPLAFKLVMSSQYSSCTNTYEGLLNDSGEQGCGTDSETGPWVKAVFEKPVKVNQILLKPLNMSGWGSAYLKGSTLQYSLDEMDWTDVEQLNDITDDIKVVQIKENIVAPFWRVLGATNYLAIGTLKFFGEISDSPVVTSFASVGKSIEVYKELVNNANSVKEGDDIQIVPQPKVNRYQEDNGDSSLKLLISCDDEELQNYVTVNSDSYAKDGKFNNYFTFPSITITNTSSETKSIVKIEMQYKNEQGEWTDMKGVALGMRYKGYYGLQYSWFDDHNVNLDAGKSVSYAVSGAIVVQGKPGSTNYTRARAHSSLPQPLVLKVIIIDNEGKKKEIWAEQANKALDLATFEERVNYLQLDKDLSRFIYCDDREQLERNYIMIYLDKSYKSVAFKNSTGLTYSYNQEFFKSQEFKAKKEEKSEVELTDLNSDSSDFKVQVHLLLDSESGYKPYACRVRLETTTNKTEQVVLIKDILNELAKL
ncbi:hypothetical protein ABK040_016134 [Willaertia magna]